MTTFAETRLRQLLKGEVFTSGKPSYILNQLRNMNDFEGSDEVIRFVLLEQLPAHVRAILSVGNVADLQVYTQMADKIVETYQPNAFQISEASVRPSQNPQLTAVAQTVSTSDPLESMLRQIIQRLDRLEATSSRPRGPSRSGTPQGNRPQHDCATTTLAMGKRLLNVTNLVIGNLILLRRKTN